MFDATEQMLRRAEALAITRLVVMSTTAGQGREIVQPIDASSQNRVCLVSAQALGLNAKWSRHIQASRLAVLECCYKSGGMGRASLELLAQGGFHTSACPNSCRKQSPRLIQRGCHSQSRMRAGHQQQPQRPVPYRT